MSLQQNWDVFHIHIALKIEEMNKNSAIFLLNVTIESDFTVQRMCYFLNVHKYDGPGNLPI